MPENHKQSLILGLGNDWLTDDGIGVLLVEKIKNEYPHLSKHFDFNVSAYGGLELIDFITGYKEVFFIDAIITQEVEPGFLWNFNVQNFKETLHLSHYHDVNFITLFDFMRKIGLETPSKVHVFAIEVLEDKEFSKTPSQALLHQLDGICLKILNEIMAH